MATEQKDSEGPAAKRPMNASSPPPHMVPTRYAARGSWVSFVALIVISLLHNRQHESVRMRLLNGALELVLLVLGPTLGILAVVRIRKHGPRHLLPEAMIGLVLNGLVWLLLILVLVVTLVTR